MTSVPMQPTPSNPSVLEDAQTVHYSNPLSHINTNVDLVEMLSCNQIGESMNMLCPDLPGLPARLNKDHYITKGMNESERTKVARTRNRVTVAKSRRRKKLYNIFLDCAIIQLSELLRHRQSQIDAHVNNGSDR